MQEKGRISAFQLGLLNITMIIATADVFLPAFVAREARQDSWIAVIIGTIASLIVANVIITLGLRHPEKTLSQYCCDILWKPLGIIVALLYLLMYLIIAYGSARELAEIFITSFNPNAPTSFYSIVIILVSAYAVKKGFEVIARINDILLPIGLFVLFFIAVVNIPKMDMKNYLPVMYNGIYPSIRGAILISSFILETVILLQFIPFVRDKNNIRKYINTSIIIVGLGLLLGVLTIAVLGVAVTEKMLFPALQFVRVASIGRHITNLDISIMVVWFSGIYIKIATTYYAVVLAIAQLFNFKTYKNMIIPVGLLIIAFSIYNAKNTAEVVHFIHHIFPMLMISMGVIVPTLLLIASFVKKGFSSSGQSAADTNSKKSSS